MTSSRVPWNTCGAFMAQTLGVATFAYAPFAFFNLLSPVISAACALTGFTIEQIEPVQSHAAEIYAEASNR